MPLPKWFDIQFYLENSDPPEHGNWQEAKYGLVSRQIAGGGWNVALGWGTVSRVEVVLGTESMSCIHSHPQFEKLQPGETLSRYGWIWFTKQRADEILDHYLAYTAARQTEARGVEE